MPPGVSHRTTGPRLLATIGALTGAYRLSKRQTQVLLADLFGIELSVFTANNATSIGKVQRNWL